MKRLFNLIILILFVHYCKSNGAEEAILRTKKTVTSWGLMFEQHEILTEDGYILTSLRFRQSNETRSLKPILFCHGMYGKGEEYIILGRKSIVYMLAKRGYDIWLMNARGSQYSLKHKTLNPDKDLDFWKFSWHEIGYYDIAANIDYIINVTQSKDVYFVGHSQGGTTYYVLTSTRPEYNKKIRAAANFGTGIYRGNKIETVITIGARHSRLFELLIYRWDYYRLYKDISSITKFIQRLCSMSLSMSKFCIMLTGITVGKYLTLVNPAIVGYGASIGIGGGSTLQALHFMQNAKDAAFRQFDFGILKNFEVYKRPTPPDYDTKKSTAPVLNFYTDDDYFSPLLSIKNITSDNPNGKLYYVANKYFTHFDYAVADNADKLIYEPVYQYFESFN